MIAELQAWFQEHHVLTIKVFAIMFAALLAHYLIQRFLKGLHKQLGKTETPWDDIFAEAVSKPVAWLVALLGLSASINLVNAGRADTMLAQIDSFRSIAVLVLVAWFLIRFVKQAEKVLTERASDSPHEMTTIMAVAKVLRAAIIVTVILMSMQAMGYSIEGVLAFGGIGGLAIGFAAKDLLSNFFGGLMVYLDRPFVVGDWVRSPDKNIEGVVEDIGWRLTVIRTFDKRPLYVPNSVFTSIAIENPSRMLNRRIYETVGVRYDDASKVKLIVDDVREMLKNHKDIDTNQTMIVNFNAFGASSLDFFVYTFTKTTNWIEYHHIKQDVLIRIHDIIASHGAEVAFPTTTVHMIGDEPVDSLATNS